MQIAGDRDIELSSPTIGDLEWHSSFLGELEELNSNSGQPIGSDALPSGSGEYRSRQRR
jgi:hypothetical protein